MGKAKGVMPPLHEPENPLVMLGFDSMKVTWAAFSLDCKIKGRESNSVMDGCVKQTAEWLKKSVKEIESSGDEEVTFRYPLAEVLQLALVHAKVKEQTTSTSEIVSHVKKLSRQLAKVAKGGKIATNQEKLAYLYNFCIELSKEIGLRQSTVVKKY